MHSVDVRLCIIVVIVDISVNFFLVTLLSTVKEAAKHLREDVDSVRKYDVIMILCDFQSLRDTLPVSALNTVKAVAKSLPIISTLTLPLFSFTNSLQWRSIHSTKTK